MRAVERLKGTWAFILAASALPASYLVAMPCGGACAGCPLGGGCIAAYPAVLALVFIVKAAKAGKRMLRRSA